MHIPAQIEYMLRKLGDNGFEAYLVGGCVRDFLLGGTPCDYDITTSATPEETISVFAGDRVIPTGLKHGTVTVLYDGMAAEITTYRTETTYTDGRHPDKVEFSRNIKDDLCRRDFTVNAMAMDIGGNIIDLYGGKDDLEKGIIKAVGNPYERFTEDALRILRAFRFAAKLGFDIEKETLDAAASLASRLSFVSRERIFVELEKLLCGMAAGKILKIMFEKRIFDCIFEKPVINFSVLDVIDTLPCRADVRLAALFLYDNRLSEHVRSLKTSLAFSTHVKEIVICNLPDDCSAPALRRLLHECGSAAIDRAIIEGREELALKLENIYESEKCFNISDLAIDGKCVMALTGKSGKAVGEILKTLLHAVFDEKVENTHAALSEYLKKVDNGEKV